jgi:hypothetical protein
MRTCIGVEKDGPLEFLHGGVQMRLKEREVVDGALAVRRRDHEPWIRTDFARHPIHYPLVSNQKRNCLLYPV